MAFGHAEGFGCQRLGGGGEAEGIDAAFELADVLLEAVDCFGDEEIDIQVVRVGEFDREIAVVGEAAGFEDVLADAFGERVLAGDDCFDRLHDVRAAGGDVRAGPAEILREGSLEDLQHAVQGINRIE